MAYKRKRMLTSPQYDLELLSNDSNRAKAVVKSPDHHNMRVIQVDSKTCIVRPFDDDPELAIEEYKRIYSNPKHVINNIV